MPLINKASDFEVTVMSAQFGESETGTPFVELSFENAEGERINGWVYLSEKAFERAVKTLRDAFGFDGNFETLPAQVTGKRCSITTEFDEYDGKERLKVKWINALRRPVKPIAGGVDFLKRLTAQAARIPATAPAIARAPARAAAPVPAASTVKQPDPF